MKKYLLLLAISLYSAADNASETALLKDPAESENISFKLIPQVQSLNYLKGKDFHWEQRLPIFYDEGFSSEAVYLKCLLASGIDQEPKLVLSSAERPLRGIYLRHNSQIEAKEGYTIRSNEHQLSLSASTGEGLMRAIQSLRQILAPAFEESKTQHWSLPPFEIVDAPRFEHRGLLLDVCRHFFSVEAVKKQIDLLALYRMNVLHLHLTEDQAWRLESEAFPKLNEIGSWRIEKDGSRYGGYYSKKELREIVAYAEDRHIKVIPEIELPGHAQAALAAYPQFSCLGADAAISVANDWGVFKEIYCAGNDSTFLFLETILDEVMEIFPSRFIHIGGDEAPKYRWEHCAKCQARIVEEGLLDEHELQSYFIRRIEAYLNKNGRELIGWDEILEGGLSPTATVQSWRGMEGGLKALEAGNRAIMSPTSHCYLDYGLDRIDVEKVYSFDPIPTGVSPVKAALILGGECNMWTEYVPDENTLDQKIHPRMQALAEVLWTYPEKRDFADFYQRLQNHYPLLDRLSVNYGPETVPATIYADVYPDSNKVFIGAKRNLADLNLSVSWNDTSGPWGFDLKESGVLKVQATKAGRPYGQSISQAFAFHKALAAEVNYQEQFSTYYPAGGSLALVNGRLGSLNFRDGQWQGFAGKDVDLQLNLDSLQVIDSLAMNFYQYNNAWIFLPQKLKVYYSEDGNNWKRLGKVKPHLAPEERGQHIERFTISKQVRAAYLRIEISSLKVVPDWHEAAGSSAWVFVDEIEVY